VTLPPGALAAFVQRSETGSSGATTMVATFSNWTLFSFEQPVGQASVACADAGLVIATTAGNAKAK